VATQPKIDAFAVLQEHCETKDTGVAAHKEIRSWKSQITEVPSQQAYCPTAKPQ
jgi:hypothetical protein